jgi:hypothetical protein
MDRQGLVEFEKEPISTNLQQPSNTVIPEAILIGNPAYNRLNSGSPIKAFGDDKLYSGRPVVITKKDRNLFGGGHTEQAPW